jgi:hypothetical protein
MMHILMANIIRTTYHIVVPTTMATSLPIFAANQWKHGGQKGKAKNEQTQSHWYELCSQYELQCKNKPKLGHADFLCSLLSGSAIKDTQGNRVIFGKKWRSYCKGELHASSAMERCMEKVVQYLELHVRLYL